MQAFRPRGVSQVERDMNCSQGRVATVPKIRWVPGREGLLTGPSAVERIDATCLAMGSVACSMCTCGMGPMSGPSDFAQLASCA